MHLSIAPVTFQCLPNSPEVKANVLLIPRKSLSGVGQALPLPGSLLSRSAPVAWASLAAAGTPCEPTPQRTPGGLSVLRRACCLPHSHFWRFKRLLLTEDFSWAAYLHLNYLPSTSSTFYLPSLNYFHSMRHHLGYYVIYLCFLWVSLSAIIIECNSEEISACVFSPIL